ncbi:hypothetical protein ACLB2K_059342 [Fragaria x ananassa]
MAAATAAPKLHRYSSSSGPPNTLTGSSKVAVHIPYSCFSSTRAKRSLPVRARGRYQQEENDDSNTTGFNSPQNDLEYLGKVLAGSIVGGAVINYLTSDQAKSCKWMMFCTWSLEISTSCVGI